MCKGRAGVDSVKPLQIAQVIDGDGLCLHHGLAALRDQVGDAGHRRAGLEGLRLGQRQHGGIVGQRAHALALHPGQIDDDDDVVQFAADPISQTTSGHARDTSVWNEYLLITRSSGNHYVEATMIAQFVVDIGRPIEIDCLGGVPSLYRMGDGGEVQLLRGIMIP